MGRREEGLDPALPAHRAALATRLRELRRECGAPPYRTLSRLAHCGSGSLSEAAGGRRYPTWETTRGYVSGCLRHAGREGEIEAALPVWRRAWDEGALLERSSRAAAAPPEIVEHRSALPERPGRPGVWGRAAVLIVLLATMAASAAAPPPVTPMAGLYNILVVPFESAPALQQTVAGELSRWAAGGTTVALRGPAGVDRVPGMAEPGRTAALERLARAYGADIVLTGRLHVTADEWTVVIELLLTGRVFGETPEFVGRHELRRTEPADLVRGNVELGRRLADDTVRYVRGVLSFVRGLGAYALEDYPAAEREFRAAAGATGRTEIVHLMLGNAIGRGPGRRYAAAAEQFRQALAQRPGYPRATVGLAEALRAGAGCTEDGEAALREAAGLYRQALEAPDAPLLEMRTRLGLGLTYQCLSLARAGHFWTEADAEFAVVRQRQRAGRWTGAAKRHAHRLAAEARAGQALTTYVTAAGRSDRYAAAAKAYEEALVLLAAAGPRNGEREVVLLTNLRDLYRLLDRPESARSADERIRAAGGTP